MNNSITNVLDLSLRVDNELANNNTTEAARLNSELNMALDKLSNMTGAGDISDDLRSLKMLNDQLLKGMNSTTAPAKKHVILFFIPGCPSCDSFSGRWSEIKRQLDADPSLKVYNVNTSKPSANGLLDTVAKMNVHVDTVPSLVVVNGPHGNKFNGSLNEADDASIINFAKN